MADLVTPAVRSAMMSGIRGKNTQPELILRKGLFGRGIRVRSHVASLPGRPDLVTRKYKTVILVHGCFWHAHDGCSYFRVPDGNRKFWIEKLRRNRKRDATSLAILQATGWRVAVVWECATRLAPEAALDALYKFVVGNKRFVEIAASKDRKRLDVRFRSEKAGPDM